MKVRAPLWKSSAGVPAWPFVGIGLVILFAGAWGLALLPRRILPPCGFHLVTGHPCPTCGSTRTFLHLLGGHFFAALKVNPLMTAVLATLGLWVLAGLGALLFGRDLRLDLSASEERWFWVGLLAAFLANWAYLWTAGV